MTSPVPKVVVAAKIFTTLYTSDPEVVFAPVTVTDVGTAVVPSLALNSLIPLVLVQVPVDSALNGCGSIKLN